MDDPVSLAHFLELRATENSGQIAVALMLLFAPGRNGSGPEFPLLAKWD
jgi:hypothetical protein